MLARQLMNMKTRKLSYLLNDMTTYY